MTKTQDRVNNRKVKSIAFYSTSGEDALTVLRLLGPAKILGIEVNHAGKYGMPINIDAVNDADLVIIQRDFCRNYDYYQEIISRSKSQNIPVVLDLDDLLIKLPEDHPDRLNGFYTHALLPLLQAILEVDLITVATQKLKEILLPFNPKIEVIPNYLDDSLWKIKKRNHFDEGKHKIVIGYMGGYTHEADLLMVLPALIQLVEKYPERIQFQFWGINPPKELMTISTVNWCPPNSSLYSDFVEYFQEQEMDIAIAPLCDNPFNHCKSPIKFLEYSAIGVPGVYSLITPYTNIIENEKDGLLAGSTEEWLNALSRLIDSPELGNLMIKTAQKKILDQWLLSKNVIKRLNIYEELVSKSQIYKKPNQLLFDLIKNLSKQYFEKHRLESLEKETMATRINVQIEKIQAQKLNIEEKIFKIKSQTAIIEEDVNLINSQTAIIEEDIIMINSQKAIIEENIVLINTQKEIIEEIQAKIEELTKFKYDLEDEIIKYVTSKSWTITRPIRHLSRFFKGRK